MAVDVEREAARFLRRFKPGTRRPTSEEIARAVVGDDVRFVPMPRMVAATAARATVGTRPCIAYWLGLDPLTKRWKIVHEASETHLARIGYGEEDAELVAEALTAALIVPREIYLEKMRAYGRRFPRLAAEFLTSETCVALRLGEVTDEPVIVDAPTGVRVRGTTVALPKDPAALAKARRLPPGLRSVRLRDDPARRVIVAA